MQRQYAFCAVVVENNLLSILRHTGFGRIDFPFYHKELLLEQRVGCRILGIVSTPVILFRIPLHVVATDGIFNVVGAVLQLDDFPLIILFPESHTGELLTHAKLFPIIGEGPGAVAVVNDGPDFCFGKSGHLITGHGDIHTTVIITVISVGAGQGFVMGRIVNDNLISVYQRTLRGAAQLEFFESGIPQLQGVLETADRCGHRHHIIHSNGPSAVLILGYHSFVELNGSPGIILQGDIGIAVLAAVIIHFGNRQIPEHHISADICFGQSADGGGLCLQGHTGGLFIGAAIQLRQSIVVLSCSGGNDRISQRDVREVFRHSGADTASGILQVYILPIQKGYNALDCQISRSIILAQSLCNGDGFRLIGRSHLAPGFPFYLVEGKLIGITVGVAADSCISVTAELVLGILVAGQGNGVVSLSQEASLTVFIHGKSPHIITGLDSVGVPSLGCNGHTVAVGELHATFSHGNVPDCPSRICQLVTAHCRLDSCNPTTFQNTRGIAGVGDHHILTGCQLFCS